MCSNLACRGRLTSNAPSIDALGFDLSGAVLDGFIFTVGRQAIVAQVSHQGGTGLVKNPERGAVHQASKRAATGEAGGYEGTNCKTGNFHQRRVYHVTLFL